MSSGHDIHAALSSSFRSGSPLAEQVIAQDLAEWTDEEDVADSVIQDGSESEDDVGPTMFRRPSGVAFGAARPVFNIQGLDEPALSALERKQSRNAERSLLRDNHVLPPKHPYKRQNFVAQLYRRLFSTKVRPYDEEGPDIVVQPPSETSPLLGDGNGVSSSAHQHLNETWEQAVAQGRIRTTWQRETKTIVAYSTPLIMTFLLQYSINVASIFAVGRIGKIELGAVSCKS